MRHARFPFWIFLVSLPLAQANAKDAIPYQFRQPLLESPDPLSSSHAEKQVSAAPSVSLWRNRVAENCRSHLGTIFAEGDRSGDEQLLNACLGRPVDLAELGQHAQARPARVADIAFFATDNTPSGVAKPTPAAIVTAVAGSRVELVYLLGQRVRRGMLNLERPHWRVDPRTGELENSYLRKRQKNDPPQTSYLAGELFRGFVTLEN